VAEPKNPSSNGDEVPPSGIEAYLMSMGLLPKGRRETVRETIIRTIRESEETMAKPPPPSTSFWTFADKAIAGLCETLALLFGLPFGDDLYHSSPVTWLHLFYLAIGLIFAVSGPMWPWIRTISWIPEGFSASLSRAALDARIWIAVLLLIFMYGVVPEIYQRISQNVVHHPSVIHATQEEIATAIAPIQSKLNALIHERNNLKRDLAEAKAQENTLKQALNKSNIIQSPTTQNALGGPITWNAELTTWTSGDTGGTLFLGLCIRGKANALTELTQAVAISELTGEKKNLQIGLGPGPKLASISDINEIPPGAAVELWLIFLPSIHADKLLAEWGKFRIHIEYSGIKYDKVFDEKYMTAFIQHFPGSHIGPHITKKDQSK
jgi:hypothetical protein